MDVFALDRSVVGDYSAFARSFTSVKNRRTRAVRQHLILGKTRPGHHAAVLDSEPAPPMRRFDITDVSDTRIGVFAPQRKDGRGHPPPRHHQLATLGLVSDSSPGRSRTAVADCLSGRAWRGPIRGLPADPSSPNRDCTKARPPYRHMPRMRAPTSTRTPSLAGRTADPGAAVGHPIRSKRPSSPSGMKRVREA
jgi:hypothetical protein